MRWRWRRAVASSPINMAAPSAFSISPRWPRSRALRSATTIAATADGQRVIVANWESNTLSIIDATELKMKAEVKVGNGPRAFGAFLRRKASA